MIFICYGLKIRLRSCFCWFLFVCLTPWHKNYVTKFSETYIEGASCPILIQFWLPKVKFQDSLKVFLAITPERIEVWLWRQHVIFSAPNDLFIRCQMTNTNSTERWRISSRKIKTIKDLEVNFWGGYASQNYAALVVVCWLLSFQFHTVTCCFSLLKSKLVWNLSFFKTFVSSVMSSRAICVGFLKSLIRGKKDRLMRPTWKAMMH